MFSRSRLPLSAIRLSVYSPETGCLSRKMKPSDSNESGCAAGSISSATASSFASPPGSEIAAFALASGLTMATAAQQGANGLGCSLGLEESVDRRLRGVREARRTRSSRRHRPPWQASSICPAAAAAGRAEWGGDQNGRRDRLPDRVRGQPHHERILKRQSSSSFSTICVC